MASGSAWEGPDQAVELAPYDPAWPRRFDEERELLERTIGSLAVGGIHHVGSTAVPGLAAKPIIDVMVGVAALDDARPFAAAIGSLGYCYWPHRPWMLWFCKPSPAVRTHHLHVIEVDHPEFAVRLAFRDRLRASPATAAAYAALEAGLAERHPDDREAYTEGKADFVQAVVERALGDR